MTVYVFGEPGMLLVKVGVSSSGHALDEREKALGRFWRDGKLLYHSSWRATGLDERAAHRLLRPRFWFEGEWFVCGEQIAKAVVRRVVRTSLRERRNSIREGRKQVPQRVHQIWAESMRRPGREFTEADERLCDEAWAKWEAAGGKPRRKRKGRP